MKTTLTMNAKEQKLSLVVDLKNGRLGKNLSADEAENVVMHLEEALQETGREAFKQWLLRFESDADVLVVNGKTYRFKMTAEKEFLTKFGHVTIPVACLDKVASFSCSKAGVQNIVDEMGEYLEEHEDELMESVRIVEELPVTEIECVAISLDGVNVWLNTPGPKKGRPTERPKDEASMSRETASCYKNAMVGIVSFYGEVPPEKPGKTSVKALANRPGPKRLAGHVTARMPEDKFPTFRRKIETEIHSAIERLPPDVTKILLNDGGTNLWTYADAEPLYDDFEKIVDFHHVLEHVSSGAEGIFGKGTAEGKVWYRKMEGTLLSYEDGADRVIRSLEYYSNGYKYKKSSRKLIESCLTFMRNNVHRMEYKRFRDNDWPIGSGPVEGACKNIVKKRMCQSGQRWSLQGGQAVLSLRAIVKSNRWSIFWNAYKRQAPSPKLTQPT